MLVEGGAQFSVAAAQGLMRRCLHHLAVLHPAGTLVSQHAAGQLAHTIGSDGGVVLQDTGQVSQQVIEERRDSFISWCDGIFNVIKSCYVLFVTSLPCSVEEHFQSHC